MGGGTGFPEQVAAHHSMASLQNAINAMSDEELMQTFKDHKVHTSEWWHRWSSSYKDMLNDALRDRCILSQVKPLTEMPREELLRYYAHLRYPSRDRVHKEMSGFGLNDPEHERGRSRLSLLGDEERAVQEEIFRRMPEDRLLSVLRDIEKLTEK